LTLALEERVVTLPEEYDSPALRELSSRFSTSQRGHVLDLGQPSNDNVHFFAGLHCKISVCDFFVGLTEVGFAVRRRAGPFAEACTDILGFSSDDRFDQVMVWDLFNYMTLEEIEVFMQRLRGYCREGCRLMALLSIYKRIPDQPFRCLAIAGGRVRYESQSDVQRESPRHKEHDLLSRLAGFRLETSLLLRGGMQEYGFVV
jgi:hypothetical protein